MDTKMKQFPTNISNPVLSVGMDGTVLYSNEAGEPLLHEWGVRVGEKLPSSIGYIAQRVISRNNPEKIEVKVGKSVYLIVFHPLSMQECVNISGFDISGQKEFEEKPLESKEKYQDLFNLIEQAVQIGEIVFDENGRSIDNIILDVNLAYEKHSGLRREQVIGRGFKEIFPIVEQRWLDRYGEVVRTGMGMHFEEYNASLDRWFEVFASPMGSNRFIAVFSDITRHKQTEEDLLRSEQHYRLLHETMLQGVVYQDASGKIISMNPAAERILGKTPAEFLGSSSVGEEYLTIREDGSMFPGLEHPAMVSLRTGQKVQGVVMGVYNPRENFYRWININAVPIFRTGEDRPFQVYTLFDDITERKQEEHRIRRYNRILKGINRIFSNVVQAKTEEEVGNACLSVALEVTGSEFGFINEMGTDGLLHDVAKSDLGWERCFMYDKTGHRRPPSFFAVHGLYGSVIINEKGFFTSDPPSHPDSIGIPYGHPPLTSFLGVPLVQDGKTIGLIAVANREGGYSSEQQEDLEAIAPAVVQALQRKKAEEALRLSNIYNRSLIESSLDPLVTIGRDGKITDVNCATEQVTGYSRNDLIKTDFSDYFTEPENARAGYKQVFTDGEVRDYPLEIQHKDGHITPVLYNASVYRDENGEVIGVFAAARDITERKKAEEALKKAYDNLDKLVKERTAELEKAYTSLKESEKGLAEAQKMAHIGNWDLDLVTGEVFWSDELYQIFGRNPQESGATYHELLNYIHPDDRDFVDSAIKKGLNEKPSGIDYRVLLANGEERNVHAESEVIFDENDVPVRAKGIVQDITERKKSEEKIRNLANIVESSSDAIGTISLEGVITSWNKGAEQVYGYSAEEILGKTESILTLPHLSEETKKLTDRVIKGERINNYETSRLRKDGTIINVSLTLSPVFDASGKLTAVSVIARDITERKRVEEKLREIEEKYRNIVETANEGILIIDDEAIITYANKKMADMLGYTLEEGLGRPVWDFADEESKTILKQSLEKRRQGINGSYELKLICKDGSSLWALINAKSIFDKDGKFMGTVSMLTDITKRKKAEEALERMDKARIKEIHHRIKNNLQIISSLLDLQAEKFEDENVIESFREGQNRVISMSLIHEELYKGEGTDTLDFSAYFKKLAENLFKTYNLSSKNISLSMDLEEDTFFDMDTAVPLGIIVNELVSNSLKHAFNEDEEGKIRIKLCREEKNSEMGMSLFSLTVSDDGKGLPDDMELKCVESLGLQLVNILVDQLDGELQLKREQGTEFTIKFKVIEKDNPAHAGLKSQKNG
ncbi:PAS domain S-box protein [Methanosarcina mazei]|uniref:Sensory transduction histidine kinase n=1 Tax=Methanosarcina mazei S-6 TaxID=213585 RepID=A0A0E3RJD2_METMZ|nr:PAS domain S-box protein [Methanosarcina mazei]AKB64330.1 sensory transduction histidine kinase [Methanosarcina mazei S-6]